MIQLKLIWHLNYYLIEAQHSDYEQEDQLTLLRKQNDEWRINYNYKGGEISESIGIQKLAGNHYDKVSSWCISDNCKFTETNDPDADHSACILTIDGGVQVAWKIIYLNVQGAKLLSSATVENINFRAMRLYVVGERNEPQR